MTVKPPVAKTPIVKATSEDDVVPDVPTNKNPATPIVGIDKPTAIPLEPTVVSVIPTNSPIIPTATTAVSNKPTESASKPENVFMPAMPVAELTPAIPATPTPRSLAEFVQTAVVPDKSAAPQQHMGPILVYTYTQKMLADGLYVIAACVANVGDEPENSINLTFNSAAPVTIQHLLSASEFGEIEQNQRGFINIASLPPNRQKQFELVVTSPEMPLPERLSINVNGAYKLNRPEEMKIKCEPQGTLSKLPDFAPVEITIGGAEADPNIIADLVANQATNPTQKAKNDLKNIQPPSGLLNFPYDSTFMVFVGVGLAMAAVFGLMTIGRRL